MFGCGGAVRGIPIQGVEAWEIPVGRDLVSYLDLGEMLSLPYQPRGLHDVPVDAAQALTELVGVASPGDLLVCPSTTRATDTGPVYVPNHVLAVGVRGIALWVDDLPYDRIVAALPYRDIVLIEHQLARQYGQLTVLGIEHRLNLRYRATSWPTISDLLVRLRARTVGQPVPPAMDGADLTVTWDHLITSALVTLGGRAGPTVVSADTERVHRWRRRTWPAIAATLTRHEFVLLGDATGRLPLAHGVDLLAVPRTRLTGLRAAGTYLDVTAAGVQRRIGLGSAAVATIMAGLAPQVLRTTRCRHSRPTTAASAAIVQAGRQ